MSEECMYCSKEKELSCGVCEDCTKRLWAKINEKLNEEQDEQKEVRQKRDK